jgi:hypothetical protein
MLNHVADNIGISLSGGDHGGGGSFDVHMPKQGRA